MSNDAVLQTIELVRQQVSEIQADLVEKQTTVNNLCSIAGIDPIYAIESVESVSSVSLKGDEYFNKPAATAIRMVLESRKSQGNGPSTLVEIYERLIEGGYKFDAKNEANAKNSLRVTLSKNTTFHKLPNKKFGLSEWYGLKLDKKTKKSNSSNDDVDPEIEGAEKMKEEFGEEDPQASEAKKKVKT